MNTYTLSKADSGTVTLTLGDNFQASWTPYQLDSLAYNYRIDSRDDMEGLAEHVRDNGTVNDADIVLINS